MNETVPPPFVKRQKKSDPYRCSPDHILHSRLIMSRRLVEITTGTGRITRARCLSRPNTLLVNLWITGIVRVGGVSAGKPRPDFGMNDLEQRPHIWQTGGNYSDSGLDASPHACWDLVIYFYISEEPSYVGWGIIPRTGNVFTLGGKLNQDDQTNDVEY